MLLLFTKILRIWKGATNIFKILRILEISIFIIFRPFPPWKQPKKSQKFSCALRALLIFTISGEFLERSYYYLQKSVNSWRGATIAGFFRVNPVNPCQPQLVVPRPGRSIIQNIMTNWRFGTLQKTHKILIPTTRYQRGLIIFSFNNFIDLPKQFETDSVTVTGLTTKIPLRINKLTTKNVQRFALEKGWQPKSL